MTAIWHDNGSGWRLLAPVGFPDEADLHTLVEQAPHILPLAGSPGLVVVAREALLGNGYADLIAVEPSGRLAIIEVKLARNAEARRAVVAQVLTYAAYLKGVDPAVLEQSVLGRHLKQRDYQSLAGAVEANDQEGSFDAATFTTGLADSLANGRFRLVLVLDSAPEELIRLVGYLQTVTDKLLIDLITVAAYTINGERVLVPQRVEAEMQAVPSTPLPIPAKTEGRTVEGVDDFKASFETAEEQYRPLLKRLCEWAISLENEGLVKLFTYHGKGRTTLLPYLKADNVGLLTIYNDHGAYLQFWRSVFQRRAPNSLPNVEDLITPDRVGQGTVSRIINDDVLMALTAAYREAATGVIVEEPAIGGSTG